MSISWPRVIDPTATGEAVNLGYGQASGTSMASPHVAGAAVLIKQIHPTWSPAWIKSALMSTSKYTDIFTDAAKTIPAQPLDMGAGRLDLTNAADPGVILDPPSLSFGQVLNGETATIEVKVTSVAAAAETYALSTVYTGMGFGSPTTVDGMTVTPASLTLNPGETKSFTVEWNTATSKGYGDNQGFVLLTGSTHKAHLPAWMRVGYAPMTGKVLILDNDASDSLGLPDYAPVYKAALDMLSISSDIYDADAQAGTNPTIPDATELAQYDAIVYETGDNYQPNGTFTVPTPLTSLDMDRLVEYANNGGHLIAFGQDLAAVTAGNTSNSPFFYSGLLGAKYLQDSINGEEVFADSAQLMSGLPGTPFSNTSFDISAMGDGAGNQAYVDEVKVDCYEPNLPQTCAQFAPLMKYSVGGNFVDQGTVALANRDQPTLERPGRMFNGNALYFTFGLEGVNNDTGYNTREDLLGSALDWAWDTATASIQAKPMPMGQVSYFTAEMDSTFGGDGVTFRWDFGDGTPFTSVYTSATSGHTYAAPGIYTVRVEATNGLGTRVIGQTRVTVGYRTFLPQIH